MNKLSVEALSEIQGGSNAGYAIGRAIGSAINGIKEYIGNLLAYDPCWN